MVRALAWKPVWASIIEVNSCARSTLDCSSDPGVSEPRPPVPGLPVFATPEAALSWKWFWPTRSSPAGLLKTASCIVPSALLVPLL